ncbi:MAG: EamA family transporter [Firmicutes bacterium HGW-Firmicutes-15]|nr:MAG: EamA family transporter [Firmicutes bacterium HGW-Firmicutes-15]
MQSYIGKLYLAGAFILAGSSVIAARVLSGKLGIFTITSSSLVLSLLVLLPFCGYRLKSNLEKMAIVDWKIIFLQALCGMFLFRMFLLTGLKYTSAGEAGILTGASPALTALMARFWLSEPLYKNRIMGVVSTVSGILLIQTAVGQGNGFTKEHFIGNMLVLSAALCESLFNVISRRANLKMETQQLQKLDPIVQSILVSAIAGLLCLWPAALEYPLESLLSLGLIEWLALLWYGLMVTALGYIFWYAGIKRCDASIAAAFSGLMPFTSLLVSIALLGEQPGWQSCLGGFMIVLGMLMTGWKVFPHLQIISSSKTLNNR